MGFEGYKLGFSFHAVHSDIKGDDKGEHSHTFLITLYFQNINKELDLFNNLEEQINLWLEPYQNKNLNNTELFENSPTTVEVIAKNFFQELKQKEKQWGVHLVRLDIQDKLSRTYSVSDVLLDSNVNEIAVVPNDFREELEYEKEKAIDREEIKKEEIQEERIENNEVESELEELLQEIAVTEETDEENSMEVIIAEETVGLGVAPVEITIKKSKRSASRSKHKARIVFTLKIIASLSVFLTFFIGIMYFIRVGGNYPQGSDTLCHLYRSDLLLDYIKKGNLYPLYDHMWYNGVEIMRYWAPLPLYILAGIQGAIRGTSSDAYVVFCGLIYLVGAIGWLIHGIRFKRIGLAVFLGTAWFFFPENMRLLILDGNLPRVIINTALPFFLISLWKFIEEEKKSSMIFIILYTSFMGLCHIGITFMVVACVLIYVGLYAAASKKKHIVWQVALGMVLGICIIGIWMIPSLKGGAASRGESGNQVMVLFFESAFVALNPVDRFNGDLSVFYYGLSIFFISLFGTLFGTKKTLPGFLSTLVIFLCTTKSVYQLFVHLPFSQFLWMIRFVPISFAFFVFAMFLWKELKKGIMVLLCLLLLIDCYSSIPYVYVEPEGRISDEQTIKYNLGESLLINEAKEITKQRMAIMELSTFGAYAPYYVSGIGTKRAYTFGAGWEGAQTAGNIVLLNTALETGRYVYMFDRCIELGTDTVLCPIHCLKEKEQDIEKVIQAGERLGYELIDQNSSSLLFQLELDEKIENFGTITVYENIAIGVAAKEIALLYPVFEEGSSSNLDDYSVEELMRYKKIYLSDFTYTDKEKTEAKLTQVAENGTKIIIDMNRIPVNKKTNCYEMFGVNAQSITFTQEFPTLKYMEEDYMASSFNEDLSQWNTVYLTGLSTVDGYTYMNNKKLPFVGSAENENIVFLGFNIVYHTQITSDIVTELLLFQIFMEYGKGVPQREIVPIKVSYGENVITIESDKNGVNTSLACLDIFDSNKEIIQKNNLLVVNEGTTTITLHYPYFVEGLSVSIIGIVATIIYSSVIIILGRKKLKEKEQ